MTAHIHIDTNIETNAAIAALLDRFQVFGIQLGLERIRALLAALGNPQDRVPIVHVAATNGKGSVCAYLSSVLTAAGFRVGRYTSPHLIDWTERVCLNDRPIAPEELLDALERTVAAIAPETPCPTRFEVLTAAAWLYFAEQKVDIVAMEVGLGGRLDATNACDRPLVCAIVSIGWDHWQYLGPTIADIALEKAGILKPGRPVVVGRLPLEAENAIRDRAIALNCPVIRAQPAERSGRSEVARYEGIEYPLALAGDVQLQNSAVAIAILQQLRLQGWQLTDAAIAAGMGATRWPARLQWLEWNGRSLLADGAHNADAATALRHYLDTLPPQPTDWILGILAAKDAAGILKALLRAGDRLHLVPVPERATADPEELARLARRICPSLFSVRIYADFRQPFAWLPPPEGRLVLCGSLYLIGAFLRHRAIAGR